MKIVEVKKDLFSVKLGYYIAHCISADFALGAGIAKKINEVYNMRLKLSKQFKYKEHRVGKALCVDNVFNLVIKEGCRDKALCNDLEDALWNMKEQMLEKDITKVAMPQIGCGKERLDWDEVTDLLEDIFDDTDVEILVCSL